MKETAKTQASVKTNVGAALEYIAKNIKLGDTKENQALWLLDHVSAMLALSRNLIGKEEVDGYLSAALADNTQIELVQKPAAAKLH